MRQCSTDDMQGLEQKIKVLEMCNLEYQGGYGVKMEFNENERKEEGKQFIIKPQGKSE